VEKKLFLNECLICFSFWKALKTQSFSNLRLISPTTRF